MISLLQLKKQKPICEIRVIRRHKNKRIMKQQNFVATVSAVVIGIITLLTGIILSNATE